MLVVGGGRSIPRHRIVIGAAIVIVLAVVLGVLVRSDDAPSAPDGGSAPTAEAPPITPAGAPVGSCLEPIDLPVDAERLWGLSPPATAACAALSALPSGSDHAVVATSTTAAFVAAPVAKQHGGPVLLAGTDGLPGETVTALEDLGVDHVLLVGGASERLVDALDRLVGSVEHVPGEDLTELSVELAGSLNGEGPLYVVSAEPADLLLGAAAAARDGGPLVVLAGAAADEVTALAGSRETIAVGHPTTLPDDWLVPLRDRGSVTRVDGPDRAGTAAGLARRQPPPHRIELVIDTPEALSHAVPVAWRADEEAALLLTSPAALSGETDRWIRLGGADGATTGRVVAPPADGGVVDEFGAALAGARDGLPAAEVRGAWAHLFDDSLKTRSGITTFLDRAVQTGLNTVVVQVSRRQDAYYTSEILPRTTDPELEPGLDILAELLPRAHARGLEVHAWVAVAQSWHEVYRELPAPDGWVWTDHGPGSDDPWLTRPHPDRAQGLGYPDAYRTYPYLDLGVPAVADHITATMVEIASRYPVDAVHLDYLRYPGQAWGYHPTALRRFAEETGRSVDPPPAPSDQAWSDWRRAQGTRLLERIRREVTEARPGVAVSAAVIAQGEGPGAIGGFDRTVAHSELMQDWAAWVRQGLLDLTIPMAYFDERQYAARYDQWVEFAAGLADGGAEVAIGQASWLNPTAMSLSQAEQALSETRGLVLYSYQQDTWCPAGRTETGEPCSPVEPPTTLWRELAEGPFREPAPPR